jgi:hypothetical protein
MATDRQVYVTGQAFNAAADGSANDYETNSCYKSKC